MFPDYDKTEHDGWDGSEELQAQANAELESGQYPIFVAEYTDEDYELDLLLSDCEEPEEIVEFCDYCKEAFLSDDPNVYHRIRGTPGHSVKTLVCKKCTIEHNVQNIF